MATDTTTALPLDNPFWHYALARWQQPGLEAACLTLQDEGLSINRLLFCLWLGENGLQLPAHCDPADHWQRTVSHPQRALRFTVRPLQAQQPELARVYQAMRKAELACEQVEIALLYQCSLQSAPASAGQALVEQNLQQWLTQQHKTALMQHPALQTLQLFTAQSPAVTHSRPANEN